MTRAWGVFVLLLLGAAAAVQFNDPDPFRWVLFYGLGALVGGLAVFAKLWYRHALGYAILAFGVGIVHLVVGRDGIGADWLDVEPVREGLGALIASALTGVLAWLRHRDAPNQPSPYLRREDGSTPS